MTAKPANRRGHPAGDDLALWRRTIRDIAPLRPHGKLPEGNEPHAAVQGPSPRSPLTSAGQTPADRLSRRPEPSLGSLVGIDRANAERLKRGQHEIEARLDLHGLRQSVA